MLFLGQQANLKLLEMAKKWKKAKEVPDESETKESEVKEEIMSPVKVNEREGDSDTDIESTSSEDNE